MQANREGYVCRWLISGPALSEPIHDIRDKNQLAFEKKLRAVIADDALSAPPSVVAPGASGVAGCPWRYYPAGENWFVDQSTFYHLLTKVELWAACELWADEALTCSARLWTFAAVDLWVNGEKVAAREAPVYKPIRRVDLTLPLRKGKNEVFARLQNLGVRDTRTIFGLQILSGADKLDVRLPDPDGTLERVYAKERFLASVRVENGALTAKDAPMDEVRVSVKPGGETLSWKSGQTLPLPKGTLSAELSLDGLKRTLEDRSPLAPAFAPSGTPEAHRARVFAKMAVGENAYCVYERFALGLATEKDDESLLAAIERVAPRPDCADFELSALLRLFLQFDVKSPAVRARMREVAMDFRYWMDENGADGMCFWSENHALLFYGCQMLSGLLYPDETFHRSGRTGREQAEEGAKRCEQWCDSILADGFEEFLSSGYMCVTAAALLNVIDFAPEAVSEKACRAMDRLLRQHALHAFHGSVIAPQGRVYRDVIYPPQQGVQAILHYIDPEAPEAYSYWLAGFAKTKYALPDGLTDIMRAPASEHYACGNAEIAIEKQAEYALTSTQSPKGVAGGWSNEVYVTRDPAVTGVFDYEYVKALNERFHGTSLVEPGVYGYQQHLIYACLSPRCTVFVNHPGGTHDASQMRPGYWYGNGLFPALRQSKNRAAMIYSLADLHPVTFTHVFWDRNAFDETVLKGQWAFGRKGEGYVALWCSGALEPHDDILTDCEWRVYAPRAAYAIEVSSKRESGGFEAFMEKTAASAPAFDEAALTLKWADIDMQFVACHNDSQYV